jgi:hypothetical protein
MACNKLLLYQAAVYQRNRCAVMLAVWFLDKGAPLPNSLLNIKNFGMFSLLLLLAKSEFYPILVGTKRGFKIQTPNQLVTAGALGENHVCFVIDRFALPQIKTIRELGKFGDAMRYCEAAGSMKSFSDVDSAEFDFLKYLRSSFHKIMNLDAANECTCKADNFEEGLLIVRVTDDDPHAISEILEKVPSDVTVSFIASTDKLFKY